MAERAVPKETVETNKKPENEQYRLRGHRVPSMTLNQISSVVDAVCRQFSIGPGFHEEFEHYIDWFSVELGLTIDIVDDKTWGLHDLANGHYDPATFTIRIPDRVMKKLQSHDNRVFEEGLLTIFHELGHFCLLHRAVLHETSEPASPEVDSEVQADLFAELMLNKVLPVRQMELDF